MQKKKHLVETWHFKLQAWLLLNPLSVYNIQLLLAEKKSVLSRTLDFWVGMLVDTLLIMLSVQTTY